MLCSGELSEIDGLHLFQQTCAVFTALDNTDSIE
jgi:hypothetical protein